MISWRRGVSIEWVIEQYERQLVRRSIMSVQTIRFRAAGGNVAARSVRASTHRSCVFQANQLTFHSRPAPPFQRVARPTRPMRANVAAIASAPAERSARYWPDLGAVALLIAERLADLRCAARPAAARRRRNPLGHGCARNARHRRLDRAAAAGPRVPRTAADDDVDDGRRRLVARRRRPDRRPAAERHRRRAHVAPHLRLRPQFRFDSNGARIGAGLRHDGPGVANRPARRIRSRVRAVGQRVAAALAPRLHARLAAARGVVARFRVSPRSRHW